MKAPTPWLILLATIFVFAGCSGTDTNDGLTDNPGGAANAGNWPMEASSATQVALESADIPTHMETNVESFGKDIEEGLEWFLESETMGCMFDDDEPATPVSAEGMPRDMDDSWYEDEMSDEDDEFDVERVSEDIAEFLNEEVMTEVESEDGMSVVYRVDPVAIFCMNDDEVMVASPSDMAWPEGEEPAEFEPSDDEPRGDRPEHHDGIDEDCAQTFDGIAISVRIVSYDDGNLNITLIINEMEAVLAEVHKSRLSVAVNLGEAKKIWSLFEANFSDMDKDGEAPAIFDTLEGIVGVALEVSDTQQIIASVAATTNVVVAGQLDGHAISLNIAPSQLSLIFDKAAKSVEVAGLLDGLDLTVAGELVSMILGDSCDDEAGTMMSPGPEDMWDGDAIPNEEPGECEGDDCDEPDDDGEWDGSDEPEHHEEPMYDECESNEMGGLFALTLPGASVTVKMLDNMENLEVNNLKLGDAQTTITWNGQTIMTLDLNAAIGRAVSASVALCADEPKVTLDPGLDVQAMFAMSPLADDVPDITGSWVENDTLGITFDGTNPTMAMDPMQVVSGELRFTSAARPDLNLTVSEGMCIDGSSEDEVVHVTTGAEWDGESDMEMPAEPMPEDYEDDEDDDDHPFSGMEVITCEAP